MTSPIWQHKGRSPMLLTLWPSQTPVNSVSSWPRAIERLRLKSWVVVVASHYSQWSEEPKGGQRESKHPSIRRRQELKKWTLVFRTLRKHHESQALLRDQSNPSPRRDRKVSPSSLQSRYFFSVKLKNPTLTGHISLFVCSTNRMFKPRGFSWE